MVSKIIATYSKQITQQLSDLQDFIVIEIDPSQRKDCYWRNKKIFSQEKTNLIKGEKKD